MPGRGQAQGALGEDVVCGDCEAGAPRMCLGIEQEADVMGWGFFKNMTVEVYEFLFFYAGMKPRALCLLGKCSTTELLLTPQGSGVYSSFRIISWDRRSRGRF